MVRRPKEAPSTSLDDLGLGNMTMLVYMFYKKFLDVEIIRFVPVESLCSCEAPTTSGYFSVQNDI